MKHSQKNYKLAKCVDYLKKQDKLTFFASLMQCLHISFDNRVPTAGVYYDTKVKRFKMAINEDFVDKLTVEEYAAVYLHEVFHISHKHVLININQFNKPLCNVAMDLVINQFIDNLPKEAMTLDKFRDSNGAPFPANKTFEYYYSLLMNDSEINLPKQQGDQSEGDGEGKSSSGGSGKGDNWVKAKDAFKQDEHPFDAHGWNEGDGESADEKEKLEALSELFQRAMIKHSREFSKGNVPNSVTELLIELEKKIKGINYKQILLSTLRKSIPSKDFEKTWKRPSRRYGIEAKGNKTAAMPYIHVLLDTSGSISINEGNEFLKVLEGFMTVGVSKAMIHLFHTEMYHSQQVKRSVKVNREVWQSGGTDLTDAFEKLSKERCDLLVVLTDGYYSRPDVDYKKMPQTVFVIPENCNLDHPIKDLGKTVAYKTML